LESSLKGLDLVQIKSCWKSVLRSTFDTEATSLFTEPALFSFTILLSPSSDDLWMFYNLRFPDLRRVFPSMD
jgi:hypothetical protein